MHVRGARPDDYEAWLEFVTYLGVGGTPTDRERFIAGIVPNAIFVEDAGVLVGYALSFAFGTRGDVRQIAVAPAARKRGIGALLMASVKAKLVAAGCTDWRLEVLADNAAAIALYRSVGMRELSLTHELRVDPRTFARAVVPVETQEPDGDAAIEAAFDLGRGQIQRWRSFRPAARLVHVGDRAFAQLIDNFADDHGLIFPLLATDEDSVRSILAIAEPKTYEIPVDHALIGMFAGAEIVRDAYIYGGSLRE